MLVILSEVHLDNPTVCIDGWEYSLFSFLGINPSGNPLWRICNCFTSTHIPLSWEFHITLLCPGFCRRLSFSSFVWPIGRFTPSSSNPHCIFSIYFYSRTSWFRCKWPSSSSSSIVAFIHTIDTLVALHTYCSSTNHFPWTSRSPSIRIQSFQV